MNPESPKWRVLIACGGTGGHLFPGLAVAQELRQREARVALLVSPKDVDQQGVRSVADHFEIHTLPVVAFSVRRPIGFGRAWWRGYRQMRRMFSEQPPAAVLAMGGFV